MMKNEEDPPKDETDMSSNSGTGEPGGKVIIDSHGIARNPKGQFAAKHELEKKDKDVKSAVNQPDLMLEVETLREQHRVLQGQVENLTDGLQETQIIVHDIQEANALDNANTAKMLEEKFDGLQKQVMATLMQFLHDNKSKVTHNDVKPVNSLSDDDGAVGMATLVGGESSPSPLIVPNNLDKIAAETPYLKSLDGESLQYTASSSDFDGFYNQLRVIAPDVTFITALKYK